MSKSVCVVGAGSSGLAAIRELRLAGHEVACFEAGTAIGGSWRYGNDNGVSAAYASLHANVSRRNMHYPSLHFPGAIDERPHHSSSSHTWRATPRSTICLGASALARA